MKPKEEVVLSHSEIAMMMALVASLDPEEFDDEARKIIERCRALAIRASLGMFWGDAL